MQILNDTEAVSTVSSGLLIFATTSGADTGFGRGRGQEIFRWDNGVSREVTEGVWGGGGSSSRN